MNKRSSQIQNISKQFQLKNCLLLFVFISFNLGGFGQINIGENATLGGRIGLDVSYHARTKITSFQEPFRIRMSAQPYFKVKDWDFKFNILVGDYHKKFRQEFNKFGTSFGNDWLTFHVGHHNQQFSSFTLNSHTILGGGIELNPGKFRFAGSYGRFRRDIDPTDFTDEFTIPSYNRWGLAGKIGVGTEENYLDLIILRVEDKANSLDAANAGGVLPQDNSVIALRTFQKLFKKSLEIDAELALSAITNDNTVTDEDTSSFSLPKIAGYLIGRNSTTEYAKAINASISYHKNRKRNAESVPKMNGFLIKAIYQRIDPNYQSMGTYYLRNDLQRIRLNAQLRFNQNKIIISPQIGYENNDLEKQRVARNNRIIGGLNTSVRVGTNTTINFNYLNFNSALENNTLDSLILKRVNHNVQFSVSNRHIINNNPQKKNKLFVAGGYQLGKNKNSEINTTYLGSFNGKISYNMVLKPKLIELEPAFRVNTYKRISGNQMRITPSVSAKSTLLDNKMILNYSLSSILASFSGIGIVNTALRNDVRLNYRFTKKQSLSFRLTYQQNFIKSGTNYGDFRTDLRWLVSL